MNRNLQDLILKFATTSHKDEFDKEIALHQVKKTFKDRKANNENTGKWRSAKLPLPAEDTLL